MPRLKVNKIKPEVFPDTEIEILISVKGKSCLRDNLCSFVLLLFCNKPHLWVKNNGTPVIDMYVTLCKILDLREPIFSTEGGRDNCLYFALFSRIEVLCEIVFVVGVLLMIFSWNIFVLWFKYRSPRPSSHKHFNYHLNYKRKGITLFILC